MLPGAIQLFSRMHFLVQRIMKSMQQKKIKIGGRGDSDEDKLYVVVVVVMVVMMMSLVVMVVTVMVNGCVLMMMPERASARARSDAELKKIK